MPVRKFCLIIILQLAGDFIEFLLLKDIVFVEIVRTFDRAFAYKRFQHMPESWLTVPPTQILFPIERENAWHLHRRERCGGAVSRVLFW